MVVARGSFLLRELHSAKACWFRCASAVSSIRLSANTRQVRTASLKNESGSAATSEQKSATTLLTVSRSALIESLLEHVSFRCTHRPARLYNSG